MPKRTLILGLILAVALLWFGLRGHFQEPVAAPSSQPASGVRAEGVTVASLN